MAEIQAPVQGKHRPMTTCPACGALLQFQVKMYGVTQVERPQQEPTPPTPPTRSPEDAAFLAAARAGGLLEPFAQVVAVVRSGGAGMPHDLEGYLLTIMQSLISRRLPASSLALIRRAVGDEGHLEYWQSQGIGVATIARRVRLFIPQTFLLGARVKTLSGHRKGLATPDLWNDGLAEEWIRTRFGYVAGPGALLDALQQRSFGAFARPAL